VQASVVVQFNPAEIKTLSFSVSSASSFRALVRFCFPFLNDFTIEVPRREPVD
jgi:hypothetical protein